MEEAMNSNRKRFPVLIPVLVAVLYLPQVGANRARADEPAGVKPGGGTRDTQGGLAIKPESDEDVVAELKRRTQGLLDAIGRGHKSVWERELAEDSLYSDEEGRVLTKAELLKELSPLPAGYAGSIRIGDVKAVAHGNVVVLSHRDREDLELYGQKLVAYYQTPSTWAKNPDGRWQIVSTQAMAVPCERK